MAVIFHSFSQYSQQQQKSLAVIALGTEHTERDWLLPSLSEVAVKDAAAAAPAIAVCVCVWPVIDRNWYKSGSGDQ